LTGVRTFGGDEELLLVAVLLGVTESHLRIVTKKRGNHRQSSRSVRFRSCILPTRTPRGSCGARSAPQNPKPYLSLNANREPRAGVAVERAPSKVRTLASGAPRPGSWMMSVTTPLT
jgi:hypothetical protein